MPKLETFYLEDFEVTSENAGYSAFDTPVFMHTGDGQGAFEFLSVETVDNSAKKSARIGGIALLSGARFNGLVSYQDQAGEIIVRHLA